MADPTASGATPPAASAAGVGPARVRNRAPEIDPEFEGILDRSTLSPEFHYRFIHERPQRMSRMKAKGYRVVSATESGVKTYTGEVTADDTIRDGDTILMAIPIERYQEGRKKVAKVTKARLTAPKAQFRKKAKGAGPGGVDVNVVTTDREMK